MNEKRTLIKNSTINLISYVYILVIAIFYIPLLLNNLGTQFFGLYIIFAAIPQLVSSLDFGLTASTIKHLITNNKNDLYSYWSTSYKLFFQLGLSYAILTYITLYLLMGYDSFSVIGTMDYLNLSLIISIAIFLDYLIMHAITYSQSRQRFEIYNIRTFIVGSNGLVAALVSIISPHLPTIFFARIFTRLITLLILTIDYRKSVSPPRFSSSTTSHRRNLLNFGLRNFAGKAVNQIQAHFPKYAILAYIGSTAVAIYSIPLTLIQRAVGVISQISLAFFPFAATLSSNKIQKLKTVYIFSQISIALLGVIGVIVINYLSYPVLLWWLNDASLVQSIIPILKILSYALAILMLSPLPSALFDGLGKPQLTSFFAVITTVIEVILILLLIPSQQIFAPAYASLIAVSITTPFLLWKSIQVLNSVNTKVK